MRVSFVIDKETEKAFYCQVRLTHFDRPEDYRWIPKSVCRVEEFVATLNAATNKPESYGKRVIEVADWWVKKNLGGYHV